MRNGRQEQGDGYVFARVQEEYERLDAQAKIWDEATRRVLTKAGVQAGQRCLDIGCGTGSVMRLLGEMVGPTGSVLGVDLDRNIGAMALVALEGEQPGRHSFEVVNLATANTVLGAPFDVVFARLVVFHMADQIGALEKFWSWVAPGGVLIVMDYDLTHLKTYPEVEPVERAFGIMAATFSRVGRDEAVGAHIPLLMAKAGVGFPEGTDVSGHFVPVGALLGQVRPLLRSLAKATEAFGVADGSALDVLDQELAAQSDVAAFARGPDMIGVWKRKVG